MVSSQPALTWELSASADGVNRNQWADLAAKGSPGGAIWASVSPEPGHWHWAVYASWLREDIDASPARTLAQGTAPLEDEAKEAVARWVAAQEEGKAVMTEESQSAPGDDDLVFTFELTGRMMTRLTRDEARAVLGLDGTPDDMLPLAAGTLLSHYRHYYATAFREAGFLDADCERAWYELEGITTPAGVPLYPED